MATPALRLLLNNARPSIRLVRGSPLSRCGVGSAKDNMLLAPSHLRAQGPPRVDLEVLLATQGSGQLLRAGRSWPVFDMGTGSGRSYCRGRGADVSDDDEMEISDEDFSDDGEWIDDDDSDSGSDGMFDPDSKLGETLEKEEKRRKWD